MVARGCTAGTFAHACTARERPLSFDFMRPRSRGANVLKEPIRPFLSCRLFLPSRASHGGEMAEGRVQLPFFFPGSPSVLSCSHPPLGRDNGIHLLEEELLKRYLK